MKNPIQETFQGDSLRIVAWWAHYLSQIFRLDGKGYDRIDYPEWPPGPFLPIVTPLGLQPQTVFDVLGEKRIIVSKIPIAELSSFFSLNVRGPDKPQAIWIKARREADVKLPGQLEEAVKGITLVEGLLADFAHREITGKHLDVRRATVCTGTRAEESHGEYPVIYYDADKDVQVIDRVLPRVSIHSSGRILRTRRVHVAEPKVYLGD